MTSASTIRVRFAPSPTGLLHVGGLRTALYNFLFARRHNGVFILRIEDTDRSRYVEGAIENLIDTLHWSGLEYDEGPGKPGEVGPYIQSERLEIYREHIDILLEKKKAYRCFCTPARLEEMRKKQENLKVSSKYDRQCLRLTEKEVESNVASGLPFVVRMRIPDRRVVSFHDVIRGRVEFDGGGIDDQILMKSDGYPTYHLANVVDDHLMRVSHVIRGEEWLSSTPKHVLLYEFLGWTAPVFAHLPLLLNPDKSKLSKRQGDVAVEEYRAKGYLPEALINFVALLGWNPGTEQEILSLDELVHQFSLERVNRAGAVFDVKRLDWFNFEYLRRKPVAEVLKSLKVELASSRYKDRQFSDEYLLRVIEALGPRVSFVRELIGTGSYFFETPVEYDSGVVKKRWREGTPGHMRALTAEFSKLSNPTKQDYEKTLTQVASALGVPAGQLIHPLRLAVSGVGAGPGVYDILDIIGKEETLERMRRAIDTIVITRSN